MTDEEYKKGRSIMDNLLEKKKTNPNYSMSNDDWNYLIKIKWAETFYVIPSEYFTKLRKKKQLLY